MDEGTLHLHCRFQNMEGRCDCAGSIIIYISCTNAIQKGLVKFRSQHISLFQKKKTTKGVEKLVSAFGSRF